MSDLNTLSRGPSTNDSTCKWFLMFTYSPTQVRWYPKPPLGNGNVKPVPIFLNQLLKLLGAKQWRLKLMKKLSFQMWLYCIRIPQRDLCALCLKWFDDKNKLNYQIKENEKGAREWKQEWNKVWDFGFRCVNISMMSLLNRDIVEI